jgi:hypothetical protein
MKCNECVYEKDCWKLLNLINRIYNKFCKQGRRKNRQQNIDEAIANAASNTQS